MSPISIDPQSIDLISDTVKEAATSELLEDAKQVLNDETLIGTLNKVVNPISANNKQKQKDENLWSIYSENTKETYKNLIEGLEIIYLIHIKKQKQMNQLKH